MCHLYHIVPNGVIYTIELKEVLIYTIYLKEGVIHNIALKGVIYIIVLKEGVIFFTLQHAGSTVRPVGNTELYRCTFGVFLVTFAFIVNNSLSSLCKYKTQQYIRPS